MIGWTGAGFVGTYTTMKNISADDFAEMERMEAAYYSAEYITPANESFRWHEHNPWTGVVIGHHEKIVGFMDVLQVNDSTFQQIIRGVLNDRDLTTSHILSENELFDPTLVPKHLFFSCAVIRREYRGKGVLTALFRAYLEQLQILLQRGVVFHQVAGDCVTEDGERFSRRLGLTFHETSNHGTRIYTGSFEAFYKRISE